MNYPATFEAGGAFGYGRVVGGPLERGEITLPFGAVDDLHPGPYGHAGVDFGWWLDNRPPGSLDGNPITNRLGGVVIDKGLDSVMGYYTMIAHGDQSVPGALTSLYLHSPGPSPFAIGDTVPAGAVINIVDNTGLSTGPHLHWGMYQIQADGHRALVDPLSVLGENVPVVSEISVPVLPASEENDVQIVRTMDLATAQIALAVTEEGIKKGSATVSLLSDGDLGHVMVGLSMSTAEFMAAFPGFQR